MHHSHKECQPQLHNQNPPPTNISTFWKFQKKAVSYKIKTIFQPFYILLKYISSPDIISLISKTLQKTTKSK